MLITAINFKFSSCVLNYEFRYQSVAFNICTLQTYSYPTLKIPYSQFNQLTQSQ